MVLGLTSALQTAAAQSTAPPTDDLRLVEAAQRQDTAAVQSLLGERVDVDTPQADGATPLAWAAHWDDLGMADLLMRAGANVNAANDLGVTPLMLACSGEAWIGADRAAAGKAMEADGVDLIIMDDGHQNPSLYKDVSLIVIDSEAVFGNGHVIPKGPLREPVAAGLARADAVIVTGPGEVPEELSGTALPVIRAAIQPTAPLQQQAYVAFAGIGRPEKFFDTLEACGSKPLEAVPFPDHHKYSDSDVRYLNELAKQYDAQLITTEKDFVRLREDQRSGIVTLPIRAEFGDRSALDRVLAPVADRMAR